MATLERIAIDYQALVLFCVEHHLRLSKRFIKDFKRVVAFIHWCRYNRIFYCLIQPSLFSPFEDATTDTNLDELWLGSPYPRDHSRGTS